jgi:hypothetical protein
MNNKVERPKLKLTNVAFKNVKNIKYINTKIEKIKF